MRQAKSTCIWQIRVDAQKGHEGIEIGGHHIEEEDLEATEIVKVDVNIIAVTIDEDVPEAAACKIREESEDAI